MNNLFSIKRVALILKKDFIENWKRYILYFLGMVGIITLVQTIISNSAYHLFVTQQVSYDLLNPAILSRAFLLFIAFGIIFAAMAMEPMKDKAQRISYLSLPASDLEKYFSRWLIVTLGYIVMFFVALWLADWFRVAICSFRYPTIEVELLNLKYLVPLSGEDSKYYLMPGINRFVLLTAIYFLFQSLFVLGSTFWAKLSFLKTFAVIAGVITLFQIICRELTFVLYGDFNEFTRNLGTYLRINEGVTENQVVTTIIIIISVFTLVNWVIGYFRFRESEIIKRW